MRSSKRKQLRGPLLVDRVLDAALEQLSTKGYEGLSMEEVAARAGVNKTTVYRRWPTKSDLARSALERTAEALVIAKDHGSLRSDLSAILSGMRDFVVSAQGQTLIRMLLADDPDVARLAQDLRTQKEGVPRGIIARAVRRGELPRGTDATLVFETLAGALQHQVLFVRGTCDDRWIARVVDLVIRGAANGPTLPKRREAERAIVAASRRSKRGK